MERIVIDIPDIKSNFEGYNYLCSLYHQLKNYKDKNIVFNFSKANFIEANLCALIGTIFEMLEENNNIISLENINHNIISADGYYEFSNGQEITKVLLNPFDGTLVNLTFDLTDKHHYYLAEESQEENLDNIF